MHSIVLPVLKNIQYHNAICLSQLCFAFLAKKPFERAKVTFDYEPEKDDELKLTVGDILIVINKEEEGWWEGELNGKTGMFPSNFVEVLPNAEELPTPVVRNQTLSDTLSFSLIW